MFGNLCVFQPKDRPMPLSAAAPRKKLHHRRIDISGFEREDGQFDIEAEIKDTKTYSFTTGSGQLAAGEALHHMRARLTVDTDLVITAAEAVTEAGPFNICTGGAASFARLAGLQIKAGFLKAANERFGGTLGCTHIRELVQQMATVAFQTTYPVRARREEAAPSKSPRLLNTCFAYDSAREVVRERWPDAYTGAKESVGSNI
jgi:hypothetical protein